MSQQSIYQLGYGSRNNRAGNYCFRYSGKTQTMSAALAANSVVFAMNVGPFVTAEAPAIEYVESIKLTWTTIVAFTTPITAGRALRLSLGTNVAPTGGTLLTPFKKSSSNTEQESMFQTETGGTVRIATTVALGGTAATGSSGGDLVLTGFGNAGATLTQTFDFTQTAPLCFSQPPADPIIEALQSIVIFAPQAMDAAGTWELAVDVDTCRLPPGFPISRS